MGVSVQIYLLKLKIAEAKQLLRETSYTILEIAQAVGYEHRASLTRIFKQFEEVTPSVYRSNSRNK
jgi:AraC-like DNA-binding protein